MTMKTIRTFLLLFVAMVQTLPICAQVINGDLNQNGRLEVSDVTRLIKDYVNGTPETIPTAVDPFMVDNSHIAGTWNVSTDENRTFNVDGTTDFAPGFTYEFLPMQGYILFYNGSDVPMYSLRVVKATSNYLAVLPAGSDEPIIWYAVKPVTITLSQTSLEMEPDEYTRLIATVEPSDAGSVTWTSSNENVATVVGGFVVAVADGVAMITAEVAGKTAMCMVSVNSGTSPSVPVGDQAVTFDAVMSGVRAATRAGMTGGTNTTAALQAKGFGVFAYNTNSSLYSSSFAPNFMYNQEVTYNGGWTYFPLKYWPSESLPSTLEESSKFSFFAYAPYTPGVAMTRSLTSADMDMGDYGIVGFSRSTEAADPFVKYMVSFDLAKQVDLLWGVAGDANNAAPWSSYYGIQTMPRQRPWLNVLPPSPYNEYAIKFSFKHALAKLNVTVNMDYDNATELNESGTRIYIRSVTFKGFATKGVLNLNNTKAGIPLWLSFDGSKGISSEAITLYDGRRDGKEGIFAATNEIALINPALTETTEWNDVNAQPGVTTSASNLFINAPFSTAPIYVIPTGEPLEVTITYDVMTPDANLSGYLNDGTTHGSVIQNTITKTITLGSSGTNSLEAGKSYLLNLHLGMTSVKYDVFITDGYDDSVLLLSNED